MNSGVNTEKKNKDCGIDECRKVLTLRGFTAGIIGRAHSSATVASMLLLQAPAAITTALRHWMLCSGVWTTSMLPSVVDLHNMLPKHCQSSTGSSTVISLKDPYVVVDI